jgi:hypothetical protein
MGAHRYLGNDSRFKRVPLMSVMVKIVCNYITTKSHDLDTSILLYLFY